MTFEEFKAKFPWAFWANNIEYQVSTNEETYPSYTAGDITVHQVEVSISSRTPNGELTAAVTLSPEEAETFIAHMEQYLNSKE